MEPEQLDQDTSVEEAIASVFSELPRAVQTFILSEERTRIALELSQKYTLHVDQAGVFERSYTLMLLGVLSPENFARDLTDAGISADIAQKLLTEVNERVFVPIQRAERADTPPAAVPPPQPEPVPTAPQTPAAVAPQQAAPAVPTYTAPVAPPPAPQPEPAGVPQQWPIQPPQQPWQPTATVHVYLPTQPPVAVPPITVPAYAYPPQIQQYVPAPVAPQPEPTPAAEPLPVRPTPPPPVNLPGVPEATTQTPPLHHNNDPYREPI